MPFADSQTFRGNFYSEAVNRTVHRRFFWKYKIFDRKGVGVKDFNHSTLLFIKNKGWNLDEGNVTVAAELGLTEFIDC